jgi:hypothetical protein
MKAQVLTLLALTVTTPLCLAQVTPGQPQDNGLTPRTATFDVNPSQVNGNASTESTGVGVAANGNVIIGWEDDAPNEAGGDAAIFFWGAVWTMYDSSGARLTPVTTITNTPGPPPYDVQQSIDTYYRAYFRSDGTPTPGNTAWGPKIKAGPFGMGMGATAYYLGREVPELFDVNVDAGGGGDFPAVQLINPDGTPNGIVNFSDADAEPAGDIRIADWEQLANGNIVIVGENRQATDLVTRFGGSTARRHAVYKVVTPAGVEVKSLSLASASNEDGVDMWHGVGVTANGFALRFAVTTSSGSPIGTTVRMFDNDGNPTTGNINLTSLTGVPHNGGRGDAAGFHGNGSDAYVNIEKLAGNIPQVTVLNANGTLRWSRKVADAGDPDPTADRVDAAIAPDGRVIAAWDDSTGGLQLPQARMFNRSGDPVGEIFWVSERDQTGVASFLGRRPRVAWRGNTVAIIWESRNSPETSKQVVAARLFDVTTNFVATPQLSGLTPRTATFDVNTALVNGNESSESTGVGVAGNGNVIIGWEDDAPSAAGGDAAIFYWGAVWTLFDSTGTRLMPVTTITNNPNWRKPYDVQQTIDTYYRAYFRPDGTPTPGNTAWGPKIKAGPFGMGMGATAYFLGREVPEFYNIGVDNGGASTNDFPAVQLLNDDGTPSGIVSFSDADAEPAGGIRIADWERLSNGNIVIVGENRQNNDLVTRFGGSTARRHAVYKVVTPAGVEVKSLSLASASNEDGVDMWHGVGVTANGFALRFAVTTASGSPPGPTVRMFDNSGNPTTGNINLAAATGRPEAGGGGRGDGAGFHGNGNNAYVVVNNSAAGPWVTVLSAGGTVRWSRRVLEDHETIGADRMDGTISPDGRVIAVFDDVRVWDVGGGTLVTNRLPQARMFSPLGMPVANRFWLSERDQPHPAGVAMARAQRPRIAWRDNSVAVIWESKNSPETSKQVVAARLFDVPSLPVITSIVDNVGTITIEWTGGGPTYSVYRRTSLTDAAGQVATGLTETSYSEFKDFNQAFYHITSP